MERPHALSLLILGLCLALAGLVLLCGARLLAPLMQPPQKDAPQKTGPVSRLLGALGSTGMLLATGLLALALVLFLGPRAGWFWG